MALTVNTEVRNRISEHITNLELQNTYRAQNAFPASHKAWMEPSRSTKARVLTSSPKSLMGHLLKHIWAWL